jgi:hypothetical protein
MFSLLQMTLDTGSNEPSPSGVSAREPEDGSGDAVKI